MRILLTKTPPSHPGAWVREFCTDEPAAKIAKRTGLSVNIVEAVLAEEIAVDESIANAFDAAGIASGALLLRMQQNRDMWFDAHRDTNPSPHQRSSSAQR